MGEVYPIRRAKSIYPDENSPVFTARFVKLTIYTRGRWNFCVKSILLDIQNITNKIRRRKKWPRNAPGEEFSRRSTCVPDLYTMAHVRKVGSLVGVKYR